MPYMLNAKESYENGFRHGTDGIAFYSYGSSSTAEYQRGYIAGREFWKQQFGAYPKSGCDKWDVKRTGDSDEIANNG